MNILKRHKGNYVLFILLHVIAPVLLYSGSALCSAPDVNDQKKDIDRKIVARVNGQPIFEEDLSPYVEKEIKKFRKYGVRKDIATVETHMQKKVLDRMISQELLIQESQKLKIDNIEEKVDERVKAMTDKASHMKRPESRSEQTDPATTEGRENIRKNIYVDEYLKEKGITEPEVPEEEIRKFYEEGQENFRKDEYVKVSHILILADEKSSPEDKENAGRKAEKIREEILNGRDFAEMAREFSQDGRAASGGSLDYITRGYMPPEFDSAAFALNKNEVSDVVETKFGYHIIKVYDRKPAGFTPYEEVKDFIRKYLQEEESKKKLVSHMEELKTKAKIEVLIN